VAFLVFGSVEWLTNFEAAKETATKEDKFILLNFSGSDWCAPCIKMKAEVFGNESFLSLADEELILVRADFPRLKKNQLSKEQVKHNEGLAEKYNPLGKFPYTVLLDKNGKLLQAWDGYVFGSQDKFVEELTNSLSKQ
jgi:thioredoxin-related protein